MRRSSTAIAYLDGHRLQRALSAGVLHVFNRRNHLNRINVFPVPDGDTGTNLAFTFRAVLDAISPARHDRVDELMLQVANAALEGARGNSGAIMAQYFHAFSGAIQGRRLLTAADLGEASAAGASAAWKAMSQPVAGTLPTVLDDFSAELLARVSDGLTDFRQLLRFGLKRAQASLSDTPRQLPVLRQAGVVDAGAQGFVDLIEGIWEFVEKGRVDEIPSIQDAGSEPPVKLAEPAAHRFCTECLVTGAQLERDEIMRSLSRLEGSCLVVAGGRDRVRVHMHVDRPAELFLACESFGAITQQKADDMRRQHGLLNQPGTVSVVCDSGGDIPPEEAERLGIHIVPVRLSFGDREYMDGVSLTAEEFYSLLARSADAPLTSQPPVQDFIRVYSLLTSHGYDVVSVGLSARLSGTTAAAKQAAGKYASGKVRVVDSMSAAAGEGVLAVAAAEAAAIGFSAAEIEALLMEWIPLTRVVAVADDLAYGVKGGRVPPWVKRVTDLLHINPVLTASPKGQLTLSGFHLGRGANPSALARTVLGKMQRNRMYRVLIAHAHDPGKATELRRHILQRHQNVHSCLVTEAGPAIGVHLGQGGLIVGFMPQPEVLS